MILRAVLAAALLLLTGCRESDADKSRRHLETGRKLSAAKDWRRAIVHLKIACKLSPGQPGILYELGMAQLAARDAHEALASLYAAAQMSPPHLMAKLKLAQLMVASGEREIIGASHKYLDSVLAADPKNGEALQTRATALFSAGDLAGAEAAAGQALRLQAGNTGASVTLALVRIARKDYPGAESVLRTSLERNPHSAEAAVALGKFYLLTDRRPEAQKQFEHAVAIDSGNAPALMELAALRLGAGQVKEAGEIYQRLAALPSKEYRVFHALFLAHAGDRAGAVRELEQLWQQDRTDRNVRSALARAYGQAGRAAEGERLLSAAVKQNPNDADALLQIAELYPYTRSEHQLETDLQTVLRYQPRSALAHFLLAQEYKKRGAVQSQKTHLHEAVECDPSLLVARLALAELALLSGDAEGSLRTLDAASPAHRQMIPVIVQRIWVLLELGRHAEAEQQLRRLPEREVPEVTLQRAVVAISNRDPGAATRHLEEVLKQRPDDGRALHLLATIYFDRGDAAGAVARFRREAEAHPDNAVIRHLLGRSLLRTGDSTAARQAFESAARLDPESPSLQLELIRLDVTEKRFAAARERLVELKPPLSENPTVLLILAIVEEQSGRAAAAIPLYRKVLQREERNATALNNLAYRLAEKDDTLDEALQLAQRAREVSGSAAVEHTLGLIYHRKGLYRSAGRHLSAAVEKEPTPRRQYDLALTYLKLGKTALAQRTWADAHAVDSKLPALPPSSAAAR